MKGGMIAMVCQTIREGSECVFMTKKGCGFNGGSCHNVVDECGECTKIIESPTGKHCMIYPDPASKWAFGGCPSASHNKLVKTEKAEKINPLKASKRGNKK